MQAIIYELRAWVPLNGGTVAELEQIIEDSGHTILGTTDHEFEPQGYTCLWLLAESHCAIHTYPEHKVAYIQLSSCSQAMYEDFLKRLRKWDDVQIVENLSKPL